MPRRLLGSLALALVPCVAAACINTIEGLPPEETPGTSGTSAVTGGAGGAPGGVGGDAGGGYGEYRIIPTDGRKHAENANFDATYMGVTVGRWEGDTLVLDSVGFIDTTWIGRGGFFHSGEMRVVEKFTRQGDAILYDVTIEDPEVLLEPWVFPTRTLRRNTNPNAGLLRERGNCETSFETEAAASQIRH